MNKLRIELKTEKMNERGNNIYPVNFVNTNWLSTK